MLALAPLLLAASFSQDSLEVPDRDADALRRLFADVLFEREASARTRAIEAVLERAGDLAPTQLRLLVQLGPLREPRSARAAGGEELVEIGPTTLGYTFESHGQELRYAVDLPRGADATEPRAMLLDPGHGSAAGDTDQVRAEMMQSWRARMDEAGLPDWILVRTEILEQIGTGGVRGALPEDEVAAVFADFFRDLCSRFEIDLDRCYATGLSQTGFWAWYLGAMQPDRWAGIVPTASVAWQVDPFLSNLRNTAVCVLHGSADEICAVAPVRATAERLARLGGMARYVEIAGGGHIDPFLRSSEGLRFVAEHPRERHPRRVAWSVATLAQPWCAWLRIDAIEKEDRGVASPGRQPTAGVDGEISGQTIRLFSEGVERLTLALAPELVDLSQPITVVWNGTRIFEGVLAPDSRALLEIAAEKCDWRATCLARLSLELPGK